VTRAKKNTTKDYVKGAKGKIAEQKTRLASGYRPKITDEQKTLDGRVRKMLGRAAVAGKRDRGEKKALVTGESQVQKPENFVFEGHRASYAESRKKGSRIAKGRKSR
jgi:hypothetical protein